jgi:hypothetical protein
MNVSADIVLLGARAGVDAMTWWFLAVVAALLLTLAVTCGPTLRDSRGARIAFAFVVVGALVQCIARDMLTFLSGGAILGYAMLAFAMTGARVLTSLHALAAALLLVVGDLALLELVMLLHKSAMALSFADAGGVLAKVAEEPLAQFCLVLGFGSRVALVALCVPEGRSSAANIATLPGWVLLGVCAAAGALRLSCGGLPAFACAKPLAAALWSVPLLALVAWQLPRAAPLLLRMRSVAGALGEGLRTAAVRLLRGALRPLQCAPAALRRGEAWVSTWPVAMGVVVMLPGSCAVFLLLYHD